MLFEPQENKEMKTHTHTSESMKFAKSYLELTHIQRVKILHPPAEGYWWGGEGLTSTPPFRPTSTPLPAPPVPPSPPHQYPPPPPSTSPHPTPSNRSSKCNTTIAQMKTSIIWIFQYIFRNSTSNGICCRLRAVLYLNPLVLCLFSFSQTFLSLPSLYTSPIPSNFSDCEQFQ